MVMMMTTKQAAQFIGRSAGTLANWRTQAKGPPYKRRGGRIYYDERDLRLWLDCMEPDEKGEEAEVEASEGSTTDEGLDYPPTSDRPSKARERELLFKLQLAERELGYTQEKLEESERQLNNQANALRSCRHRIEELEADLSQTSMSSHELESALETKQATVDDLVRRNKELEQSHANQSYEIQQLKQFILKEGGWATRRRVEKIIAGSSLELDVARRQLLDERSRTQRLEKQLGELRQWQEQWFDALVIVRGVRVHDGVRMNVIVNLGSFRFANNVVFVVDKDTTYRVVNDPDEFCLPLERRRSPPQMTEPQKRPPLSSGEGPRQQPPTGRLLPERT